MTNTFEEIINECEKDNKLAYNEMSANKRNLIHSLVKDINADIYIKNPDNSYVLCFFFEGNFIRVLDFSKEEFEELSMDEPILITNEQALLLENTD